MEPWETGLLAAGCVIGGILVIVVLLFLLRRFLRGPTTGSDNRKRLDGRTVVITGANTGIGKEVARDLSKRGAEVMILVRDTTKGEAAAKEITQESGKEVRVMKLDLADLKSVRECAESMEQAVEKIDILINNAGVMLCPDWKTADGFDMQLGTNHLGHFLLNELLLPLVRKSAASSFHPRIVITSSMAHEAGTMHWDDLHFEKDFDSTKAYCQSKLANILHAKELARRLDGSGISVYSLHPGVVATDLGRHLQKYCLVKYCMWPMIRPFIKQPIHGAQTTLYCALEESIENDSGLYYSDCREKTPKPQALVEADQKKLWKISEELVGLKPNKSSEENTTSTNFYHEESLPNAANPV